MKYSTSQLTGPNIRVGNDIHKCLQKAKMGILYNKMLIKSLTPYIPDHYMRVMNQIVHLWYYRAVGVQPFKSCVVFFNEYSQTSSLVTTCNRREYNVGYIQQFYKQLPFLISLRNLCSNKKWYKSC